MPGGTAPARFWGWHCLDRRWAERIVAAAGVGRGDLVLDLGAGTGALTAALVAAGARVVAFELDPRRAAVLRDRFAGDPVRVVRADIADLRLPRRPFAVVANPPFGLAVQVLRQLTAPPARMYRADLVLPTSVARRWEADRAAARRFRATVGPPLPTTAFRPEAPMPTRVLTLDRVGRDRA